MAFVTKIKWVVLSVISLSVASIIIHLSLAKLWTVNIVPYNAIVAFPDDFSSVVGRQVIKNKKLWGSIKSLEALQPSSNARNNYTVPKEHSNGFIYAKVFGGFEMIRSSICDLVAISRLLNATLVIPEFQESLRSKGVSSKFKSFSYLYDEEQFIAYLKNDVIIAKTLPGSLMERRKRNEFPTFRPSSSASPNFYVQEILPKLKKSKVIGLVIANGGALQSVLPPTMAEIQRLRCRVSFQALQFRPEIQMLGRRMVNKLRSLGQPFLAYHPGLLRETLAYNGCAELFQDVHTELIQHRRAQMIKDKILNEDLNVNSHLRRDKGLCPLMPEEVGILLRVMGYPSKTIIYLAGSETFGGQRVLIPLRSMFINTLDRTSLCSEKELSDLVGPETPLPQKIFRPPPTKSEEELKEEWKRAGPRPRPLPPPPDRPIYQHEKEGWYGWITETPTEPDPSPMDLRMKAHRLLWDALDYIVSLEADAFFPGYNNDGSGRPDFSSLVMGHRLYETASSRTYRPDRKVVAEFFNMTRENLYHPKHNWAILVQEHLNKSMTEEGLIRQALLSKPAMFLSHPLPECSCRVASVNVANRVRGEDGQIIYGGEDICPKWMQHASMPGSSGKEGVKSEDDGLPDYESNDFVDESQSDKNGGKTNQTLVWVGIVLLLVLSGAGQDKLVRTRVESALKFAMKKPKASVVKLPFGLCGCQEENFKGREFGEIEENCSGVYCGNGFESLSQKIHLEMPLPNSVFHVSVDEWQTILTDADEMQKWLLNSDSLEFSDQIGHNSYKGAYMGKKVSIEKLRGCDKGNSYEFVLRKDLLELMTCGHKNILQFCGVCVDDNHGLCVVTKFMEGGSVHDLISKNKKLQSKDIIRIAVDVAEGIKFMNDHGVAYRDLNTQRIMLDKHGSACLGDLGIVTACKSNQEAMDYETDGYRWLAPEIIAGDPESVTETWMSNVYSFGMIIWEMVSGEAAYTAYSPVQAAVGIAACGLRPEIPKDCPQILKSLMTKCWNNTPSKRPEFSEIIAILLRNNNNNR